jgi:hypothetical protein
LIRGLVCLLLPCLELGRSGGEGVDLPACLLAWVYLWMGLGTYWVALHFMGGDMDLFAIWGVGRYLGREKGLGN